MPASFRQVVVMIPPVSAFTRGLLRGIVDYAQRVNQWQFISEAGTPPVGSRLPTDERIDGIIVGPLVSDAPQLDKMIQSMGVPAINVRATITTPIPTVATNHDAVGRMAADHLLDRGLQHFACWGGAELCLSGFERRIREAGFETQRQSPVSRSWTEQKHQIEQWMRTLPKPVGLFAPNDVLGRDMIHICRRCELRVPDDVAVIGMGDEQYICEMCHPPLSSVPLPSQRQGFRAAELLDRLMAGEAPPAASTLVEPQSVVARQSTDVLLVEDAEVAQAIAFIRRHATDPIRVEDVLRVVLISRRSLETRFRRALGRTPAMEIQRVQMEKAKHLVATSDMPMSAIAKTCGFHSASYMAQVFRRVADTTPRAYRLRHRSR